MVSVDEVAVEAVEDEAEEDDVLDIITVLN